MSFQFIVRSTREFFISEVNPEMSQQGEKKWFIDCDRYIPFLRAIKECIECATSTDEDSTQQLICDLRQLERAAKELPHISEFDSLVNTMLQHISSFLLCWRSIPPYAYKRHITMDMEALSKKCQKKSFFSCFCSAEFITWIHLYQSGYSRSEFIE